MTAIHMPQLTYLLLALWAGPNPFGDSFKRRVQATEMICSWTCATWLQVNATLTCCTVFIVVDFILKEKKRVGWVKSTLNITFHEQHLESLLHQTDHSNTISHFQKLPRCCRRKTNNFVLISNKQAKSNELQQIEKMWNNQTITQTAIKHRYESTNVSSL